MSDLIMLIFFGLLLTGAVFVGYPVGVVVGRRQGRHEAWDELIDNEEVLEAEEAA